MLQPYLARLTSRGYRGDGLIKAAERGHVDVVQSLLAEGAEGGEGSKAFFPPRTFARSLQQCSRHPDNFVAVAPLFYCAAQKAEGRAGQRSEHVRSRNMRHVRALKMKAFCAARWSQDEAVMRLLLSPAESAGGVGITAEDVRERFKLTSDLDGFLHTRSLADLRVLFEPSAEGGLGFALASPADQQSAVAALNHACALARSARHHRERATNECEERIRFWVTPLAHGGAVGLPVEDVRRSDALRWAGDMSPDTVAFLLAPTAESGAGLTGRDASRLVKQFAAVQRHRHWSYRSEHERRMTETSCEIAAEAVEKWRQQSGTEPERGEARVEEG